MLKHYLHLVLWSECRLSERGAVGQKHVRWCRSWSFRLLLAALLHSLWFRLF